MYRANNTKQRSITFRAFPKLIVGLALALSLALSLVLNSNATEEQTGPDDSQPGSDQGFKVSPPLPAKAPSNRNYISLSDSNTGSEQWETFFGSLMVRNINTAGLYVHKPVPEKSNGKTIVVLPGGGYHFVSMGNEGFPVAERLADEGYYVFVLKYRVKQSPREPQGFLASSAETFTSLGQGRLKPFPNAVKDLTSTLSFLKQECQNLGCDSSQVSVIGFSAGARTLMGALESTSNAIELQSIALIYPPTIDLIPAQQNLPLFIGIAADDPLFLQGGFKIAEEWLRHSNDLEFHLYSGGNHGFGMASNKTTSKNWIDHYLDWLALHVGKGEN